MQNYQNYKVDLSDCDKEPIHIIGRIQPHGFLFILNSQTLKVEQASENIGAFLKANLTDVIGKTLASLTTSDEYGKLEEQLRQLEGETSTKLIQLQGTMYFGHLHMCEGSLVLECEPYERPRQDQLLFELLETYSKYLNKMNRNATLVKLSQHTVQFVQEITAYDHVMLYKFDEDWNGEVIAEEVKPGLHSYLHHHFPASDIPAQARDLLLQKPIRHIVNVAATAVNIKPYLNPATGVPSNIIRSELRNPSEIHLEYLQNMGGVQATLSVSIIVEGKLWGIISCQHKSPAFMNHWKRQLCLNIAQVFANVVLAHEEQRDLQQMEEYRLKKDELLAKMLSSNSFQDGLIEHKQYLLGLTEATGVALLLDGQYYTAGDAPDEKALKDLAGWLSDHVSNGLLHTRQLSTVYTGAAELKKYASGLLALEISKFNKEYLLYFKPEISETRIWAGKPEKHIQESATYMHPRKSFAKWVQVVKEKSQPWSYSEIDIAQKLVKDLIAVVLKNQKDNLQKLNTKLRHTAEILEAKNRRLEDFTHIIAHNLRSPLSNMEGLGDLFAASPDLETAHEVMHMMHNVIRNMGATLVDLNTILESELKQQLLYEEVCLTGIVEKELQNLQAVILETGAKVDIDLQVQKLQAPKVYLESIAHNLISNSLKYRSPERQPHITIKSWEEKGAACFSVTDNGVGLDLKKYGHKMFSLYNTFHNNKDAKGLGLYLTKVQAEALGGSIKVESSPGLGSTFTVCL
ncbi:ATP-binding protein [uncultured Pontibacter sp.]|uniref:ATP-binding protein n=1 Tax=uncultured Pontibacter sp. TaxID=453356 RepID=UPI00263A33E4|nr:ATP-binding protein [uncultured Pontibacter sp.]